MPFMTLANGTSTATNSKTLSLPDIQVIPIKDSQSQREYEVYVKLPEKYQALKASGKKLPVIYITDAKWHIEVLSGTVGFLIEDVILVGISWQTNLHAEKPWESRFRDYVPALSPKAKGEAKQHLAFLKNDVVAYIEQHYAADPTNRVYFGYSLGGLFGAYALITEPTLFKSYIIGSPWLKMNVERLYALKPKSFASSAFKQVNVFLSYGEEETELAGHADNFIAQIQKKTDGNLAIHHKVIKQTDHTTAFPMTTVSSLYWLAKQLNQQSESKGI